MKATVTKALSFGCALLIGGCSTMSIDNRQEVYKTELKSGGQHIFRMAKKCWMKDEHSFFETPLYIRERLASEKVAVLELWAGVGKFPVMIIVMEEKEDGLHVSAVEKGTDVTLLRDFPSEVHYWAGGKSDCPYKS